MADGADPGAARDRRRRRDRDDLLLAAAASAGTDLGALPRHLSRVLRGRPGGEPSRRIGRVRHGHAAGTGALHGRASCGRRDPGLPPVLLHHPAIPGGQHVRRQRGVPARPRPAATRERAVAIAGGDPRARRGPELERAGLRRRGRHRVRGDVRRGAAVALGARADAGLLLDRSRFRRRRRPGGRVRPVADRRGIARRRERACQPGEPSRGARRSCC